MSILVTGAAGFIGAKACELLIKFGKNVVAIDNINDYYDVRVKNYRLKELKKLKNFVFYKADIENKKSVDNIIKKHKITAIINLAARAGVRYSMENPFVYVSTNVTGTLNLLECARENKINKFILASTSSLYAGQKMPFAETLAVNTPISPYAASKKGAEAMCYSYHYLYGIDVTILRFFTVYGPAGRPDMSIIRFIKWIDEGKPIELFGDGSQSRDFTYVEDIAKGVVKSLKKTGYKIINLGGNKPYKLSYMIGLIEKNLGKKAEYEYRPFHKADIDATWANIGEAKKVLGWSPKISLEQGIKKTVDWYIKNKSWFKNIKLTP
ncbi:MAG: SDR family NAD(P)-dependent oxidoreductase [Endomicrobia bacterium]|nr:SDR family NAD(P)-dependent oxidoreductase [Endomicrobiia bacterium]MCL2799789.1 SDR family NAD(P)-dependent oxidoreductase [Endomicrobiia bacterium]